jgi:hypothetical protein
MQAEWPRVISGCDFENAGMPLRPFNGISQRQSLSHRCYDFVTSVDASVDTLAITSAGADISFKCLL